MFLLQSLFTSKPNGSSAALLSATVAKPTFTPDFVGAYVLSLVVNDGILNSASAVVTITADSFTSFSVDPPNRTIALGETKLYYT